MKKPIIPIVILTAGLIGFCFTCSLPLQNVTSGVSPKKADFTTIEEIQGDAHLSPLQDTWVKDVRGIVTLVDDQGFWFQSEKTWDGRRSCGIYVYTRGEENPKQGDSVSVKGKVTEFGEADCLTTTEIVFPTVELRGENQDLPEPVLIGPESVTLPGTLCDDAPEGVSQSHYDPDNDQIDLWEALEGTLIQLSSVCVEGPEKYSRLPVSIESEGSSSLVQLALTNQPEAFNNAARDDTVEGPITCVVSYKWGELYLIPLHELTLIPSHRKRESTSLSPTDETLLSATLNLENFSLVGSGSSQATVFEKIDDLCITIGKALNYPDLLAVQEVMDDSGTSDSGEVGAAKNFSALCDRLYDLYGLTYYFVSCDPEDGADGGAPGANIRTGFLYQPGRVVPLTSPNSIIDQSFDDSRKPLIAEFLFKGNRFWAINCHLCSKRSDTAYYGEHQPPLLLSQPKRVSQALTLSKTITELSERMGDEPQILLMGDLNDGSDSPVLAVLKEHLSTPTDISSSEAYSYIYNGRKEQFDHILISPSLTTGAKLDIVHRYSDFSLSYTDHDPVVASIPMKEKGLVSPQGSLFFSDYGEGSGYNKYLELVNMSAYEMDLGDYSLLYCSNGSPLSEGRIIPFPEGLSIPAKGLMGIYNNRCDDAISTKGGIPLSVSFNGNDQIFLVEAENSDIIIDAIGIPGNDDNFAANLGMIRQPWIVEGSTEFSPDQWMSYSSDRVDGAVHYGVHYAGGSIFTF